MVALSKRASSSSFRQAFLRHSRQPFGCHPKPSDGPHPRGCQPGSRRQPLGCHPKRFNFYIITWLLICLISFVVFNWSVFASIDDAWNDTWRFLKSLPKETDLILSNSPQFHSLLEDKSDSIKSDSIFISKLDLLAPIVSLDSLKEKDINQALNQGVVYLINEGKDRMVLIGHSSVYPWQKTSYGQIFAHLDKLSPADKITIFLNGQFYLYQVKEIKVVRPSQLKIFPADLILITCWPPGDTEKRLIVRAKAI